MKISRWDNSKKEYVDHEIPDDWNCKTFSFDMEEEVNCVCCGKKMKFGDSYTSRRYHTAMGMGYCECENCYFSYKE